MLAEEIGNQKIGQTYYFPGSKIDGGKDGMGIQFYPKTGNPWNGIFAFGEYKGKEFSMLFEWPKTDNCIIVSRSRGYLLNVNDPFSCVDISMFPILGGLSIPEKNITILYDFTYLIAFLDGNPIWRTPRISWDGIKLNKYVLNSVEGEVWDAINEKWVLFSVDLDSGEISGGLEELEIIG